MTKQQRARIDYMPGSAAVEALRQAQDSFPNLRTQALIDKLVITGYCALQWKVPTLWGSDRDRWQLPDIPGTSGQSAVK